MKKTNLLASICGEKNARRMPATIADIIQLTTEDMVSRGLTLSDARKIRAAVQLASEIAEPQGAYRISITGPSAAIRYCLSEFRALACNAVQEEFWVVTLDTKNQPIRSHLVTRGTLRNSLVHPREVFRPAIQDAANCFLAVHNHPSGDPSPSDNDIEVTKRLESAAEIIGIPLIDHIVVAGERGISISEWRIGNRGDA